MERRRERLPHGRSAHMLGVESLWSLGLLSNRKENCLPAGGHGSNYSFTLSVIALLWCSPVAFDRGILPGLVLLSLSIILAINFRAGFAFVNGCVTITCYCHYLFFALRDNTWKAIVCFHSRKPCMDARKVTDLFENDGMFWWLCVILWQSFNTGSALGTKRAWITCRRQSSYQILIILHPIHTFLFRCLCESITSPGSLVSAYSNSHSGLALESCAL